MSTLLLLIELLTISIFTLFLLPQYLYTYIKKIALSINAILLGIIINVVYLFDKSKSGFQFETSLPIIKEYNIYFSVGIDGISLLFLILTIFIFTICIFASENINKNYKEFITYLLVIELFLIISFTITDVFFFYIFFESILIPMFLVIGLWGARERKIRAAYFFFLYTLGGSLFMLFGLLYIYITVQTFDYNIILNIILNETEQKYLWIFFFLPFGIKIPTIPFHIWLPEAHVEAPTIGSVILAALLLKLGTYGFIRFTIPIFIDANRYYNPIIITLATISVLYASLSTIRQIDLKRIIAYSSIAHMNLTVLGLFSENQQGIEGAIYLMIAHGIVSSALFFCVGILYDRYHTRLVRYYGGLILLMPLCGFFFFNFTIANMGFPGTCNFIGELLILMGLFEFNSNILVFVSTSIVWSAIYSIWLFNRIFFGSLLTYKVKITFKKSKNILFSDINYSEFIVLSLLYIFMLIFGLNSLKITTFLNIPTILFISRI